MTRTMDLEDLVFKASPTKREISISVQLKHMYLVSSGFTRVTSRKSNREFNIHIYSE